MTDLTFRSPQGFTNGNDGTGGEQPRFTQVTENLCHEIGHIQKQSSFYFQAPRESGAWAGLGWAGYGVGWARYGVGMGWAWGGHRVGRRVGMGGDGISGCIVHGVLEGRAMGRG